MQYDCNLDFPYGYLLVSGGHSIIGIAKNFEEYHEIGRTIDDAAGECFDKVARAMGLKQPWGQNLEKLASKGTPNITLPIPLANRMDHKFNVIVWS